MSNILDYLKGNVLLCDGSMGVLIQNENLDLEKDFLGKENCSEILVKTRPDVIRNIHKNYFLAGADMVETNSFGGSPITLAEFGLADEAFEINKRASQIAKEATQEFSDDRKRFVIGSIGPGTKIPSLGHITYDELENGYYIQALGLIEGGADALLIETCQDCLQFKSAVNGAKKANQALKKQTPIFVQVTVETTKTMLVGTDIGAAATIARSIDVPVFGMNCATGPQEMYEHINWLSKNWDGFISVQPNAGLPEMVDGQTHYPLKPQELAKWHERFVVDEGVNIIGGCCGTFPEHIKAVNQMLTKLDKNKRRPSPVERKVHWVPSVASLYERVALRQENSFLSIGERCNANGSKIFRTMVEEKNWDKALNVAKDQIKTGANTLDVCVALVGREEIPDMKEIVSRLRGMAKAPLVFDSTSTETLEEAFKLYAGKGILNSINLEDGENEAIKRLKIAKKYGASVIALTIDEDGMAKSCDKKLEIAKRLYELAKKEGLPPEDLIFDPLTFTVCTGNKDDRELAKETLLAIKQIRKEMPKVQITLGLSNVSFGLKPVARHVLNSVFLDEALKAGVTSAIVHVAKLYPLHKIPKNEIKTAKDLIYNNRTSDYEPLSEFMRLFENKTSTKEEKKSKPKTIEEKLKLRIVDGDKSGIEQDLDEAMKKFAPLDIVNNILLGGMKVVGELFGSGKMQLPFVLQAAETMKKAVSYLENFMEKEQGSEKGSMVLATVKGDVHDIGKNLVDIIMTNNGYKVYNIGIKQPLSNIIQALDKYKADAVGMSGLLVKSTVIMKENLEEMKKLGINVPVVLGGAALTRGFVEKDCIEAYGGKNVAYAKDAFDSLALMDKINNNTFSEYTKQTYENKKQKLEQGKTKEPKKPIIKKATKIIEKIDDIPTPPFYGSKVIENVNLDALIPYINETMLYNVQWGYRKKSLNKEQWQEYIKEELKPKLKRILDLCKTQNILQPKGVYGFYKCASNKNDVVLFDEDGLTQIGVLKFPRQDREGGISIADFFRDINDDMRDVIGLQAVTIGDKATQKALSWKDAGLYEDYLYLHGFSVEMAEAMAEHVHKTIRSELKIVQDDAIDIMEMVKKQGYRGSRYSFGYPACPDLSQQKKILELLDTKRIGLSITSELQLVPEQSTTAIVVHHPKAKYFSV